MGVLQILMMPWMLRLNVKLRTIRAYLALYDNSKLIHNRCSILLEHPKMLSYNLWDMNRRSLVLIVIRQKKDCMLVNARPSR